MFRVTGRKGMTHVALAGAVLLAVASSAAADERKRTWDDGGPTHNWTDADNWDTPTAGGPRNVGDFEFIVNIPERESGVRASCGDYEPPVIFNMSKPAEITDLFLGANTRLVLNAATDSAVLRTTEIAGIIDGQGGNFTAPKCAFSKDPGCTDIGTAAFTGSLVRLCASDASIIRIGAPTYSSTGIWADNGLSSTATFNWTLMQATGAGTLLDLSGVQSVDAGFDSTGNDNNRQMINALDGGVIDLSGAQWVRAPNDGRDRIEFNVTNGGEILLGNLEQFTSAAAGDNRIDLDAASLVFSNIQFVDRTDFDLTNNARATVGPALAEIVDSTWVLDGQSVFTGVPDTEFSATYVSTGLWADNGLSSTATFNWTLMQATGAGTLLDLSGVQSVDAGFDSTGNDNDRQMINALDGGVIDLSGAQWVRAPNDGRDRIEFNAAGAGAVIDLSSLGTITAAGSGPVRLDIADGGHVQMGNVDIQGGTTSIDLDTDSLLTVDGLQANSLVNVTLHTATDRLEASGPMILGTNVKITTPHGGTLVLGGEFLHTHGEPADDNLGLGLARVHCVGASQRLEAGGQDVDVNVQFLPDGNFGYKQLIVGGGEHKTTVELVDLHDNLEPCVPDALYLFGDEVEGQEGLRILGGSTLDIGNLNVYALLDRDAAGDVDGVLEWTRLRDLFTMPGQTSVAFKHNGNDGTIEIAGGNEALLESTAPACDATLPGSANNVVILKFDREIDAPKAGEIVIWEIMPGGAVGADLSADFTFSVCGTVLEIKESGTVVSDRTWYTISNEGGWAGVAPFKVDLEVAVGDANGDGFVLSSDVLLINEHVGCFSDCEPRYDINGDGLILSSDVLAANERVGNFGTPKPSGHSCDPLGE